MRTYTDLATMEGANEAARRAVNAILDAEGYRAPAAASGRCTNRLALAPLRQYDAARFGLGLPWDGGLMTVAASAMKAAIPSSSRFSEMIDRWHRCSPASSRPPTYVQTALPTAEMESASQRVERASGRVP